MVAKALLSPRIGVDAFLLQSDSFFKSIRMNEINKFNNWKNMYILQSLPIHDHETSTDLLVMYFRTENTRKPAFTLEKPGSLVLGKRETIAFSTYFGAFSLSTWCNVAKIDEVTVCLRVIGKALVRILHVNPDGSSMELSQTLIDVRSSDSSEAHVTMIPLKGLSGKEGILYPEITALEDGVIFEGLEYATTEPSRFPVRLAIIMTTFKREDYVLKNIQKISELILKFPGTMELIVVDNGQTLEKGKAVDGVRILPNKNYGGSGGFARGLLEALDSEKKFTHFLFCDDDIEIEIESIRRTFHLWEYLAEDSVVGGAMLTMKNMVRDSSIYEIGSWMDPATGKFEKISTLPEAQLDSSQVSDLIKHDRPKKINYYGWWFFSFSRFVVERVGFPLPLFVRGDDVEYGIRCRKSGLKFVSLLGIGVWHEVFSVKRLGLIMDFYSMRNKRIINLIHGEDLGRKNLVYSSFVNISKNLFSLRYKKAKMEATGFSELLRGPERLMEVFQTAWDYHRFLGKSLSLEIIDSKKNSPIQENFSLLTKIFSFATLNGHLFPKIIFKNENSPLTLNLNHTRIFDVFRVKTLVYRDDLTDQGYISRHDKKIFFYLLIWSFGLCLKGIIILPIIQKKYKKSFPFMKSETYWREVFKIGEK